MPNSEIKNAGAIMETDLRDVDFEKISRLVYGLCGINLHDGKKALVKARLSKRLRNGNFKSFSEYYGYVSSEEGSEELTSMIDSLSTNLTSFFREEVHFNMFRKIIFEQAGDRNEKRQVGLKIWCAGCATGEEPYTLAMVAKDTLNGNGKNAKIFATDISTRALEKAVNGIYGADRVTKIPKTLLKKYFQIGQGSWEGFFRAKRELKDMITFSRLNLMEIPLFSEPFDIIFCRNVMIYFDKKTQGNVISKFYDSMKKGGYLFIGHSESLTGLNHQFKYIEPSVYRK